MCVLVSLFLLCSCCRLPGQERELVHPEEDETGRPLCRAGTPAGGDGTGLLRPSGRSPGPLSSTLCHPPPCSIQVWTPNSSSPPRCSVCSPGHDITHRHAAVQCSQRKVTLGGCEKDHPGEMEVNFSPHRPPPGGSAPALLTSEGTPPPRSLFSHPFPEPCFVSRGQTGPQTTQDWSAASGRFPLCHGCSPTHDTSHQQHVL